MVGRSCNTTNYSFIALACSCLFIAAAGEKRKKIDLNPRDYFQSQIISNQHQTETIQESYVYKDGVKYRKYETDKGAILILASKDINETTIPTDSIFNRDLQPNIYLQKSF